MKLTLKAMRVNAGYSQKDVASIMGVTSSTVSRWETKDVGNLDLKTLCRLVKIYGASVDDLVFFAPISTT